MYSLPRKTALLILIFFYVSNAHTQSGNGKYEFGLNVGFMVYQGDLTQNRLGSFRTQKLVVDLHASSLLSDFFSIRANLAIGRLEGDDAKFQKPAYKRHRNFRFETPVYEISARLVWDPTGRQNNLRGFSPYVFGGAGVAFLDIKRDWSNLDRDWEFYNDIYLRLPEDSAHALPAVLPVLPIGGGIKYYLSAAWALSTEVTYRPPTTDYLDGFSKTTGQKYSDSYLTYTIGIIYRPGKKDPLSCPEPKY